MWRQAPPPEGGRKESSGGPAPATLPHSIPGPVPDCPPASNSGASHGDWVRRRLPGSGHPTAPCWGQAAGDRPLCPSLRKGPRPEETCLLRAQRPQRRSPAQRPPSAPPTGVAGVAQEGSRKAGGPTAPWDGRRSSDRLTHPPSMCQHSVKRSALDPHARPRTPQGRSERGPQPAAGASRTHSSFFSANHPLGTSVGTYTAGH